MKLITKIFTCLLLFVCSFSYGQMEHYNYKREVEEISGQWCKIILPNEIFGKTSNNLTDIRIFGITASNDTVEAPYLLRLTTEKISSKEKPELTVASIARHEISDGTFRNYSIKKTETKDNKQTKQTEIDIELELSVPVSHIKIEVPDTFDYYRPMTIKYLTDSFKTEQGWKYNYTTLTSGTLNSLEGKKYKFSSKTVH